MSSSASVAAHQNFGRSLRDRPEEFTWWGPSRSFPRGTTSSKASHSPEGGTLYRNSCRASMRRFRGAGALRRASPRVNAAPFPP